MNFKPKTEQEITDSKIWPKGDYQFEVFEALEKTSKAGNAMIELKLRLSDGVRTRALTDYILDETPEKLRHACIACGLLEKYETGVLSNDDFVGKRGKLRLVIEKAKGGYPAKNIVADYLTNNGALTTPNAMELLSSRRL